MNCIIIKTGQAMPRAIKRKDATQVIFNDQWAHVQFANRDLANLEQEYA